MDNKTRLDATKFIWMVLGVVLAFLFISAGIADGMESPHVVMGVVALIAGTISTGAIWNMDGSSNQSADISEQEKAKRERIDAVIRDLSSEELIALKSRLSDGTITDDVLYERMALSDDGELVSMEADS